MDENNIVNLIGKIKEEPYVSHHAFDRDFYRITISTTRNNEIEDILPVIVDEELADIKNMHIGTAIIISGQLRTRRIPKENGYKVQLYVYAKQVEITEEETKDENEVDLIGTICKPPIYRKTMRKIEICECLIGTRRQNNKWDYIPCIGWGVTARYLGTLTPGTEILLTGRIQSRDYTKKISEAQSEVLTTYEVSIKYSAITDEYDIRRNAYTAINQ